ncbi:MAG: bifunctional oligoribonuclease/PAP phosphatase NrnA [Coriobacteriaceae bacterium]|jgi:phosphoesterase RecJ-like protein|nr:bifunctional oligoribonuclease/PAP phosphatase NrnA [Coriobacteriaceae bacterium]
MQPRGDIGLARLAQRLQGHKSFIICGHTSPDGDCLGSALALRHALEACGKKAVCVLASTGAVDPALRFLPGLEQMVSLDDAALTGHAQPAVPIADAFIAVDVANLERLGDAAALRLCCKESFTIDHHGVGEDFSHCNYIDPSRASTTTIVWELLEHLGVAPTKDIATCAYTGLVTDTGGFQFQNTDAAALAMASQMVAAGADPAQVSREVFQNRRPASLRLEALMLSRMEHSPQGSFIISFLTLDDFATTGATKADAEPLVNILRSVEGIEVACILREEEGSVRGSLRARGEADVSLLAQEFGGGGHKAAAGFTVQGTLDEALVQVKGLLGRAFKEMT